MKPSSIFPFFMFVLGALITAPLAQTQTAFKADGVVESTSGGFKFPDETVQTTAASPETYAIGDTGPAGGWVFHVTTNGLHGLEAATEDLEPAQWGCAGTHIVAARGRGIGNGARNTEQILHGCEESTLFAAFRADEYVSQSGYFDWYMPSIFELDLMYENIGPGSATIGNVGGFGLWQYWSSTENFQGGAYLITFGDGVTRSSDKDSAKGVRAVRAF